MDQEQFSPFRARLGSNGRTPASILATVLLSAFVLAACWPTPAAAQYFGRNKVQYKDLTFQVLRTEHFDIYFYPTAREGVEISARLAERWYARLEKLLDHRLRGRQPLVLYASHPDFEQTNTIMGDIGEGTGGVTEALRRRIILPLAGPLGDTDHVIGHELVHAFQFDMTTKPDAGPGETGANRLPLWFIEGMAEYLSVGPVDPHTAMWLRDAAREDKLPAVKDLDNPKYFPYRWGHAFWAYVGGTYGDSVIAKMLLVGAAAGSTDAALREVLGVSDKDLSAAWHESIRAAYGDVLKSTTPPSEVGTFILGDGDLGGRMSVGPALSPDGRWIAFLSERSLISIDLYVADTATGKVIRKLTHTATSPHFSSLQFIASAGAWDADGRRVAIATVADGKAALMVFDAQSGNREREIAIAEVDEVFNPTWSPDGRSIAFTGMSRGLTDLYVVDLTSGAVRALTRDAFADLQPAWSPDGRRIAFVTDRFSSRLEVLDFGPYRLGLIDPSTGAIEQVRAFTDGKMINPQWAPDSGSLYFVSDRDGISNLYRVTLDGSVSQITSVSTGLSGITAQSPVVSVAARSGLAAVTVYDKGGYRISTLEMPPGGRPLTDVSASRRATLPPTDRSAGDVSALLADATFGLPEPQTYETRPYASGLSLEAIGQPSISIGADRFGAAIGGGLSFYFGDILGNHSLVTAVNLSQGIGGNFALSNTAAQAVYLNRTRRWNWGVVGGQVPYISGGFASGIATVNGEPALLDQTILFRQTERSGAGLVTYPFSRARRMEFQAGISQISFDQIIQTQAYSLNTGALIYNQTDRQALGDPLTLGTSSAAFVFDTSSFGATSPIAGARYRFEVAPTFGSIQYTSVLGDYRRYLMPVSFYTVALRAMHYGRYGSGGEDGRLSPLYLGYPSLVRGYDVYSYDSSECEPTSTSACPAIDRLVGSRVLIGNLEFRFPLLRPLGASQRMYGPVPIEMALFADGGVAWNGGEAPSFLGGERRGVSSVGAAVRVNLLGFAIGEFDFARPLQRDRRGWLFQFNLSPGF